MSKFYNTESPFYNKRGQLHRLDGPAYVDIDGREAWYINGKLHRGNDLPALYKCKKHEPGYEFAFYYKYGIKHREKGPAAFFSNGVVQWWLNGVEYTEDEHRFAVRNLKFKSLKV